MTIYSAGRDVMRMRNADWHEKYTLQSLWDFYQPNRVAHGAYWFDWTTEDEVAWKKFYQVWMDFLQDFKNAGGRVTTGSDSGFIYQTYGFGYILELEMLQEAGFHPLEVIRSATYYGAQALHEPKGKPIEFGLVRRRAQGRLRHHQAEPAAELQDALRHRRRAPQRRHQQARARRRHRLRDEGRHPLRRQEAGGRRGGDRGGVEEGAGHGRRLRTSGWVRGSCPALSHEGSR